MSEAKKIVIAGAGGIGRAAALLLSLRELAQFSAEIYLGDRREEVARDVVGWIEERTEGQGRVMPFLLPESGMTERFGEILRSGEILLDCLPGREAPRLARLARDHHLHYANLTEHVAETRQIMSLAAGAETGFLLQTGLAPGFINVLANGLVQRFEREHGTAVDTVGMRVGALPDNALPPHYYGFTWSSIGVATEYLQPAVVIRGGETTTRPSLTEIAPVLLRGVRYEEGLTSGGAADLPEALAGRVRHLDYKSLRQPGHFAWAQGLIDQIPATADRPAELERRMLELVPQVESDRVVLYAYVEGRDEAGHLRRLEAFRSIEPCVVGGRQLKAIQATTAAALAEAARLLLTDGLRGVVLQSRISPERFLAGPFVDFTYRSRGILGGEI